MHKCPLGAYILRTGPRRLTEHGISRFVLAMVGSLRFLNSGTVTFPSSKGGSAPLSQAQGITPIPSDAHRSFSWNRGGYVKSSQSLTVTVVVDCVPFEGTGKLPTLLELSRLVSAADTVPTVYAWIMETS